MKFLESNLRFNAWFETIMYITYSLLSCKLATSFSTFLIFILSDKNCQIIIKLMQFFRILIINFEKISFIPFLPYIFFMKYLLIDKCYWSTQNYLLGAFLTLPNQITYWYPNIEYMTILCSCHNLSCIFY